MLGPPNPFQHRPDGHNTRSDTSMRTQQSQSRAHGQDEDEGSSSRIHRSGQPHQRFLGRLFPPKNNSPYSFPHNGLHLTSESLETNVSSNQNGTESSIDLTYVHQFPANEFTQPANTVVAAPVTAASIAGQASPQVANIRDEVHTRVTRPSWGHLFDDYPLTFSFGWIALLAGIFNTGAVVGLVVARKQSSESLLFTRGQVAWLVLGVIAMISGFLALMFIKFKVSAWFQPRTRLNDEESAQRTSNEHAEWNARLNIRRRTAAIRRATLLRAGLLRNPTGTLRNNYWNALYTSTRNLLGSNAQRSGGEDIEMGDLSHQAVITNADPVINEPRGINAQSVAINTESAAINTESTTINIESAAINTESAALNTESSTINTESPATPTITEATDESDIGLQVLSRNVGPNDDEATDHIPSDRWSTFSDIQSGVLWELNSAIANTNTPNGEHNTGHQDSRSSSIYSNFADDSTAEGDDSPVSRNPGPVSRNPSLQQTVNEVATTNPFADDHIYSSADDSADDYRNPFGDDHANTSDSHVEESDSHVEESDSHADTSEADEESDENHDSFAFADRAFIAPEDEDDDDTTLVGNNTFIAPDFDDDGTTLVGDESFIAPLPQPQEPQPASAPEDVNLTSNPSTSANLNGVWHTITNSSWNFSDISPAAHPRDSMVLRSPRPAHFAELRSAMVYDDSDSDFLPPIPSPNPRRLTQRRAMVSEDLGFTPAVRFPRHAHFAEPRSAMVDDDDSSDFPPPVPARNLRRLIQRRAILDEDSDSASPLPARGPLRIIQQRRVTVNNYEGDDDSDFVPPIPARNPLRLTQQRRVTVNNDEDDDDSDLPPPIPARNPLRLSQPTSAPSFLDFAHLAIPPPSARITSSSSQRFLSSRYNPIPSFTINTRTFQDGERLFSGSSRASTYISSNLPFTSTTANVQDPRRAVSASTSLSSFPPQLRTETTEIASQRSLSSSNHVALPPSTSLKEVASRALQPMVKQRSHRFELLAGNRTRSMEGEREEWMVEKKGGKGEEEEGKSGGEEGEGKGK